jgi:sulfhydrogenase subunit beta (sulfur reductase)
VITSPAPSQTAAARQWFLARQDLDALIEAIRATGRQRHRADHSRRRHRLRRDPDRRRPAGRLARRAERRALSAGEAQRRPVFGYTVGPTSWKRFTFPPNLTIATAHRTRSASSSRCRGAAGRLPGRPGLRDRRPGIQDRVFLGSQFTDEDFQGPRRAAAFIVAVQCTTTSSTCFCTSMGTGPEVHGGYDILLTEIDDGFVVQAGSPGGRDRGQAADPPPLARRGRRRGRQRRAVRTQMGEPLPMAGVGERLKLQLDHPRWVQVADRCVECGNCTMSCPTCFCTSVVERSDLDGKTSSTERQWDSCFDVAFAKVAGGDFRARPRDRYRQWLTHKFSSWWDQFGSSGCVGCGRCIAWCPVAIDVREELAAIAPPIPPVVHPVAVSRSPPAPARTRWPAWPRSGPRPRTPRPCRSLTWIRPSCPAGPASS